MCIHDSVFFVAVCQSIVYSSVLSVLLLMGTVCRLGLSQRKRLWTSLYVPSGGHKLSFLVGVYLGRELLDHNT